MTAWVEDQRWPPEAPSNAVWSPASPLPALLLRWISQAGSLRYRKIKRRQSRTGCCPSPGRKRKSRDGVSTPSRLL